MKSECAIEVLYSDPKLAVVIKPCGIPSQADMTGDPAMPEILSEQLQRKIYPVHRLDRAVGGLMVFACSAGAAGSLGRMMEQGLFVKEYAAVVHGVPEPSSGEYFDYLLHDKRKNRSMSKGQACVDLHARPASLSYEMLDKAAGDEVFSLLKVRLATGRTHQIRAQLSARGMPIAGDGKYGAHDKCEIALWSYRLTFPYPSAEKQMAFLCLPERTWPWSMFSLEALAKDKKKAAQSGGKECI